MDLRHLHHFIALAEELHFARAAHEVDAPETIKISLTTGDLKTARERRDQIHVQIEDLVSRAQARLNAGNKANWRNRSPNRIPRPPVGLDDAMRVLGLEQRPIFRTCSTQEKQSEDNALRVAERLRINVRCFSHTEGGSGKSTTGVSPAVVAIEVGFKVFLLELDRQGTWSAWIKARERDDLDFETIEASQLSTSLATLEGAGYDLVVLDTPGTNNPAINEVMRFCDLALVPCRPTALDMQGAYLRSRLSRACTSLSRSS